MPRGAGSTAHSWLRTPLRARVEYGSHQQPDGCWWMLALPSRRPWHERALICECTTQCQLAPRVHFAHGRVLIWRHCLLHGHVKTPFLHGALCKALHMGPPAAGAVLAFQLAWTTAVLLLAAGSSFEAEQAGPRCKACGLHVLDWRRGAARTAARIRLAHCARP